MCRTLQFSIVQVRDPSGTDAILTKYTIRVRGFLALSEDTFPGVGDPVRSAEFLATVKATLETPRRPILYRIGDTTLVETTGMDAKIGPDPTEASVYQVSTGTFMVECGAIVYTVECDDECDGDLSPVLSLRWSQTESFDQNWYSHLHTEGRLIVRSDLLQSADNFRPLATPPILADYQRMSAKYKLSPDGLELSFNFEDVEVDRLPTFPATKASGEYTVVVEKPGWRRIGQVHIRLEGQKGTSRKQLMNKAIQMGYSKLRTDGFFVGTDPKKPAPPVVWGTFKEDLFVPVVDITMTAYMTNIIKKGFGPAGGGAAANFGAGFAAGFGAVILGTFGGAAAELGFELGAGMPGAAVGPVPPGGGAGGFAADIAAAAAAAVVTPEGGVVASGIASDARIPAPLVMPSVGLLTEGLAYGRPGIKPPDRKRLAGLLTAMFRDPCACLIAEGDVELRSGPNPPSFTTNETMLITTPNGPTGVGTPPGTPVPGGLPPAPTIPPNTNNIPGITQPFNIPGVLGGVAVPPASITIGPLSPDTSNQPPVVDNAPYDVWEMETEYKMETGQVLLPATGTGSTPGVGSVVTTHGGWMHLWVTWVAGRTGAPPVLPTFYVGDPNVVPIKGTVVAKDVIESADGNLLVYLISGFFHYGIKDPTKFQLVPGVAPFLSAAVLQGAQSAFHSFTPQIANNAQTGVPGSPSGTNPLVVDGVTPNQPAVAPTQFDGSGSLVDLIGTVTAAGVFPYGNDGTFYFYNPPTKP